MAYEHILVVVCSVTPHYWLKKKVYIRTFTAYVSNTAKEMVKKNSSRGNKLVRQRATQCSSQTTKTSRY